MTFFRRRLRLWASVWFLFQGASLTAIVPKDCCATHRRASHQPESAQPTAAEPKCHKTDAEAVAAAPAATVTPAETDSEAQCPMRGANGAPCPMHRGGHARHVTHAAHAPHTEHVGQAAHADHTGTSAPSSPAATCTMSAICDGPMAALVVLLAQPGVLPNRAALPIDLHVDAAPSDSSPRPIHGLVSPDLPPPRA